MHLACSKRKCAILNCRTSDLEPILSMRGRIQGPRVNPRLSFLQIKFCFNISMNLMFSLHFAFQNISKMVRDNHGAGKPLPFVLLDPPKQRPQDSLILVFRFQQNQQISQPSGWFIRAFLYHAVGRDGFSVPLESLKRIGREITPTLHS